MDQARWRELVGRHIEARRLELGLLTVNAAAGVAGISTRTWRRIEASPGSGPAPIPNPTRATRARVCLALAWSDDSIERLLVGQTPGLMLERVTDPEYSRLDELARATGGDIRELSDEDQTYVHQQMLKLLRSGPTNNTDVAPTDLQP